jgi:hypothetical protein
MRQIEGGGAEGARSAFIRGPDQGTDPADIRRGKFQGLKHKVTRISEEAISKSLVIQAEYEELRTHMATGGSQEELVRRYEESLRQIDYLMHENEEVKDTLIRMRDEHLKEIANKNAEI